jgi:hypothetical protein
VRSKAAALALLVLLSLLAALACGGDDDGGDGNNGGDDDGASDARVIEYFDSLEAALADVNGQLDALDELRADAFDAGADAAAAEAYGAAYEAYMADRLAAIDAIGPPARVDALHDALVSAASGTRSLAENLHGELTASPPASQEDFQALFGELDGASLTSRYGDACNALQAEAGGAEIGADLQCLR